MALRPVDATKLQTAVEWASMVDDLVAGLSSLAVFDARSEALAADEGRMAKDVLAELEAARTLAVKPLNDEVRSINAAFKPLTQKLEVAISELRKRIETYRARARAEAEAAARKAAEDRAALEAKAMEAAAAGLPVPAIITEVPQAPPAKTAHGAIGSTSGSMVWEFEVSDFALVPREYLSVNEKAIREAVRLGVRTIPGVRIFQREKVSFR